MKFSDKGLNISGNLVLLFDPNILKDITKKISREANKFAHNGLSIDVRRAAHGPYAIENKHDEVVAANTVLEELRLLEDHYDAFVIGCFADPGLTAARSIMKFRW